MKSCEKSAPIRNVDSFESINKAMNLNQLEITDELQRASLNTLL